MPFKPRDAQKVNFCLFHNIVNHLTHKCQLIMEKIQNLLDDREIKYQFNVEKHRVGAAVMMATHAFN